MTQEEFDKLSQWVKDGNHLPPFMRDFHDQKDIFKAVGNAKHPSPMAGEISWMEGHCYTVDKFLKWMAFQGYTLQKCRAKQPFLDIHKTLEEVAELRIQAMKQMMEIDKKSIE